jgi:hypothetical protein
MRMLLASFSGALRVHVAMEDQSLYPRLLLHPDEQVRTEARRFLDEMGELRARFAEYQRGWPTAGAIAAAPERFISETRAILLLMHARMESENSTLHPLVDERLVPAV